MRGWIVILVASLMVFLALSPAAQARNVRRVQRVQRVRVVEQVVVRPVVVRPVRSVSSYCAPSVVGHSSLRVVAPGVVIRVR